MMLTIFIFSLSLHLSRAHTYAFKCITQMTVRLSNIEGTNPNPDLYVSCAGTNYSSTKTARTEGEAVQFVAPAGARADIRVEIFKRRRPFNRRATRGRLVREFNRTSQKRYRPGCFTSDLFKLDTEIIITWKCRKDCIKCNTRTRHPRRRKVRIGRTRIFP